MSGHDCDWVVVGSGFGGSVCALRLAEKGYDVRVLECGRRFADGDFPRSTWNSRRFIWMPRLGLRGILRLTFFKDVTILSGSGVGGGSLVYANTLYRAPQRFFADRQWPAESGDVGAAMRPHYEIAERMLGAVRVPVDDEADQVLLDVARRAGVEDTYTKTNVSVFFGSPGETVPDPYFGGEGPDRAGCVSCGLCMVGCPHNAKNTLVKNYLHLAERRGVRVEAERTVVDVRPVGAADGSDGYEVTSVRSGAWLRKDRRTIRARGVVFAAGALGTNLLLRRCRERGSLPRLSERLGHLVRTNSEAILAVTSRRRDVDYSKRVAITSSIYPEPDTHVETVTYGRGGNSMRFLFSLMTGSGSRLQRPFMLLSQFVRYPSRLLTLLRPGTWSQRTIILLVMQTLDNSIRFVRWNAMRPFGVFLQTEQDPDNPNPTFIPAANAAAEAVAERIDGIAQSSIAESLAGIPTTAHILGGAVIGSSAEDGVIDHAHRVFGYARMMVCDGAAVPANPGVNPSLTITALAERAMSRVPDKPGATKPPPVRVAETPAPPSPTPAPL